MLKNARIMKFVIVGDGAVGKTTLTKVFCDNPYVDQIMTIGIDIHAKDAYVEGQKAVLQIWDISGQTQFKFLIPDFLTGANAAILAFDRSRETTFQSLDYWLGQLRIHAPKAPVLLISTKADQEYHPSLNPQMAKAYVVENNLMGFVETSAKNSINVHTPFKRLLERLYKFEPGTKRISFGDLEEEEPAEVLPTATVISPSITPTAIASPSNPSPARTITKNIYPTQEATQPTGPIDRCKFCNSPLRPSQIVLKRAGRQVLCQNCFNLT
jgi:small GTP-binding protein